MYRKAADLDHARAQARLALLLWCGGLEGIRQVCDTLIGKKDLNSSSMVL